MRSCHDDLGVGIGVDEHVAMVEGGQQAQGAAEEHAVAEHVTRHVANADHGDRRGVGVDTHPVEVAPDALPRALGRDGHALVVVAGGAAGGEGIAQPEPVLGGQTVGEVAERRGALVGGDHEVGVVAVTPHDLRRRHDHAVDDVVGDVEQPTDERAVGLPHLPRQRGAVGRGLLHDEAALGADGHDHRVLHHLGLHEPEHLGAEVLHAVGPADAAARHVTAAEVHALDAGRVHPDLVQRPRQGEVGDQGAGRA